MIVKLGLVVPKNEETVEVELRFSRGVYDELKSKGLLLDLVTKTLNLPDAFAMGARGKLVKRNTVNWNVVLHSGRIAEILSKNSSATVRRRAKLLRDGVDAMIKQLLES